jgi:hypothetical protein
MATTINSTTLIRGEFGLSSTLIDASAKQKTQSLWIDGQSEDGIFCDLSNLR